MLLNKQSLHKSMTKHKGCHYQLLHKQSDDSEDGPSEKKSQDNRHKNVYSFSHFSIKTYVVGTQKNRLNETVLLSIINICIN